MRRENFGLNKSQRMQLKALICLMGILLLAILLLGRLLILWLDREPEHIPVIRELQNIWVMEVGESDILLFENGEERRYPLAEGLIISREDREQVADVTLTDEIVTGIHSKKEKLNGRVLSAKEEYVELEGIGTVPVSKEAKGYRLYDSLAMCSVKDVMIGYDFTDFVVENGEICGILMVKEGVMEYIRVLLQTANYGGRLHEELSLTCDTDYVVRYGSYEEPTEELHQAGEVITIGRDSSYFQSERMVIEPTVLTGRVTLLNVTRSQGSPSYRGKIEITRGEEGLSVVNEVLLEEYLYSVVPSEMPASYPAESLKAQAVCARTYAYQRMLHAGYPEYGAHVDDSTSYQVYNNILEQESATTAVKETYGQLLYTEDGRTLADTYYYSTSCGIGSDASVWEGGESVSPSYLSPRPINSAAAAGEPADSALTASALQEEAVFAEFIRSRNEADYEAKESWYRWSYAVEEVDEALMLERLQKRYEANEELILTKTEKGEYESLPVEELGELVNLYIAKRGAGGVAQELVIEGTEATVKAVTEYNIRYVLSDGASKVLRQDGSEASAPNLLPSAYFVIEMRKEEGEKAGFCLIGGGFGHGVGMSQNGAKNMALKGLDSSQILTFFYQGSQLLNIYVGNCETCLQN